MVFEGAVEIYLGQEAFCLNQGDAIRSIADIRHAYRNNGTATASLSMISYYSENGISFYSENILSMIQKNGYSDGGKMKAEAFDRLQYFYGKVHEPLIHANMEFAGQIDEEILKQAVTLSIEAVPLIGCCFNTEANNPCWVKHKFTGNDVIRVVETDDACLLTVSIDIRHEPQLKIFLVRKQDNESRLYFIMNHMVCDGSGFKEYLYLLADLYTKLSEGKKAQPPLPVETRSARMLFSNMEITEKIGMLFSKYDLSAQKFQVVLPFEGDETNPFFVTAQIAEGDFNKMKAFAKSHRATVNDVILTAYVRVLSRVTQTARIIMPCPVDLRRYLPPNQNYGVCNLTSNYFCDVTVKAEELFSDTLSNVAGQMKVQKESKACLKSVMMLEVVFKVLNFKTIKRNFDKLFTLPVISFTNLGVISKELLKFGNISVKSLFITGAIKHVPYFQIAVSTFDDVCTLSSNLYGTVQDRLQIERYLEAIIAEIRGASA